MKTKFIMAFLLMASTAAFSQSNFYLSTEIVNVTEKFTESNPFSRIGPQMNHGIQTPGVNLILGYRLNSTLILESGIVFKPFRQGYSVNYMEYGFAGSSLTGDLRYQIPLRLKMDIPLIGDKLFIQPVLGYHLGFNTDKLYQSPVSSGGGHSIKGTVETTEFATYQNFRNNYHVIETGMNINYRLNKRFELSINAATGMGLNEISKLDVTTYSNQGDYSQNSLIDNGSYYSLGFGIKCNLLRKNK